MDNATRVLVIAGGVMITMFVIAVSMYMLTMFRDAYERNSQIISGNQIYSFNSYFNKYKSTISGADAYNILSKVDEVNYNVDDIIPHIQSEAGTINVNNYKDYFFFTERLLDSYSYEFKYNGAGIVYYVKIN